MTRLDVQTLRRAVPCDDPHRDAGEIAYEESGPAGGRRVILRHGFPDDVHADDGVAPPLAARRWRVLVPYLRGYGPTRFLETATPRSG